MGEETLLNCDWSFQKFLLFDHLIKTPGPPADGKLRQIGKLSARNVLLDWVPACAGKTNHGQG
ncbi:hypothetical protein C0431_08600 [bacterium]|nr:hypothetical protein [bacterium]